MLDYLSSKKIANTPELSTITFMKEAKREVIEWIRKKIILFTSEQSFWWELGYS